MSNAIPFVFPVLVEMTPGAGALQIKGLLRDLVRVNSDKVAEGLGQISLSVVARDAMSARARVESILGRSGKILEVGEQSKLNPRKHLPYRRSFVFTRFGRGRHNQQGGSAAHPAPAAAVAAPVSPVVPAIGAGAGVKESVRRLIGLPPVFEAEQSTMYRDDSTEDILADLKSAMNAEHREAWADEIEDMKKELRRRGLQPYAESSGWKATSKLMGESASDPHGIIGPPINTDVRCPHCSSTNVSQYPPGKYPPNATSRKANLQYFNYYKCKGCGTTFATNKDAPAPPGGAFQHESQVTPSRSLRGYPKALKVNETLRNLPPEFLNSNRGRRVVYDAVEMIRREEGHTPAEIISDAYMDSQTVVTGALDELGPIQLGEHKVCLSFPTQESRDKALVGAVQFCEQCSEAVPWGKSGVEFHVSAESAGRARSLIEGAIYRMNIRQFSLA